MHHSLSAGLCLLSIGAEAQTLPPSGPLAIAPIAISSTGTHVCFAAAALRTGVTVTAQASTSGSITANAKAIALGPATVTTSNADLLAPGASRTLSVSQLGQVCINGTAGDGATASGN